MLIRNISFALALLTLSLAFSLASCGGGSDESPDAKTEAPETTTAESGSATDVAATDGMSETEAMEVMQEATPTLAREPTPTFEPMSVDAINTQTGRHLYGEACAPCHGFSATGIEGIGINLIESPFVAGMSSEQLAEFLIRGLSINSPFNETDIRMPPRGGRDDLDNQEMLNIAAYLKSVNTAPENPQQERVVAYLDWVASGGQEEIAATPEVGKEGLTGAALEGQTIYLRFCSVCHGPNGEGVESLGRSLRGNEFIENLSDEELAQFISQGRGANEPLNETGIEMLPYGGQPYLTDNELNQLVAFMRGINSEEFIPPIPSDSEVAEAAEGTEIHEAMEEEAFALIENITPRCFACHLISERGNANGPGPSLNGLRDRAATRVEGMSAEEYVRESILDPGAFLVEQCPRGPCVDVMVKNYEEKISDEDLDILVNFLLSLQDDESRMIAEAEEDGGAEDETTGESLGVVLPEETEGVRVRAVDLLGAWVDQGAINGDFVFIAQDSFTYTADFQNNILPLFTTPGIWYTDSESCINCHFEQSEDSDHEMDLSTYEGIMAGGDVLSDPPGIPIVTPGDWEHSMLRSRLRDTRMPPDPGWEWDPTEENRDGPTLTINGGEVRAVPLLGHWVNQGAVEGQFAFQGTDGITYTAMFNEHVLPLFTEPGAWYADSAPCTDCHFEQSEDSDHEMDMSSYAGIMAGADVLSEPPGVPIVVPGDWEHSKLRDRLRNTRMPPSPGWEWDPTEENRDGPTLSVVPHGQTRRISANAAATVTPTTEIDPNAPAVRAVDLIGAWVDQGAVNGEFNFTGEDGGTYLANFEQHVLPLFTEPGAWYQDSESCLNCHFENSEDSDHEMDLSSYEGIMAGGDVLSEPPGVPIVTPGDWEHSMLRSRLRDTRMPPDPGWEWDPTEENRDGPTLTINGGEVRAVPLLGHWVNQGAVEGQFAFQGTDGLTYTATFNEHVLPLFTEPGAWYADSAPCTDCHFEQSEDSDHEMDMYSYAGIMAGADVLSDPPGVPIVVPGDWEHSKLRDRLRNTRMPPSPGWEWDRTEENRDGPTLHIPQP